MKIIVDCAICGKTFASNHKSTKYCSDKCRKEATLIASREYAENKKKGIIKIRQCIYCKKDFKVSTKNRKYCSKDCREKEEIGRVRERRRKEKKNKVKKCAYCSKEYKQEHSRQKYCSKECGLLARSERERIAREQEKRKKINESLENRPDLRHRKPKDKNYKIRKYILKTHSKNGQLDQFERDFNYFKPCKFDENNENLYYIHDFNDSDLSSSLIKFSDTALSEKEFEYYNARGNLVFYEMM